MNGDFQYHAAVLLFCVLFMKEYDFIIIGSGPGGYIAAIRAAQLGYRVAIVEREDGRLGGVCLNWGCIPTKSLLKSAELYKKMLAAGSYGICVDGKLTPDIPKIVSRSREAVSKLNNGVALLMKKNNVEVLFGHAKTLGNGKVSVSSCNDGEQFFLARHIILATGGSARVPEHLDAKLMWLAKDAMVPRALPQSLLIIGSGAIGLEFASFYGALGCRITIVEMKDRILPLEDSDISSCMCEILRSQGMKIYTNSTVGALRKKAGSVVEAEIIEGSSSNSPIVERFDRVICAIGIVPNTNNLGLENTKVQLNSAGYVVTDYMCRTDEPGMYAIGDVAGVPCLAHKASHEAVICVEGIASAEGTLKKNVHPLNTSNVPSCIYTIPQVASVGMTEDQARAKGMDIKVGVSRANCNGKAIASGITDGFVKVIFCNTTGELLGAHLIGEEVTEMINGYLVCKQLEATDQDLAATIFPHPTLSEMLHSAVLSARKEPLDC